MAVAEAPLLALVGMVSVTGLLFAIAVAALAFGAYVEQAGAAAQFAPDEKPPESLGAFALMVMTTLSPGMLLAHAYFITTPAPGQPRVLAISLVVAAVVVGAIVGRLVGGAWQGGARFMRAASLPVNIAVFVVAVYTAWPTLTGLLDLFTTGRMRLSPPAF
jgi:hypothetical protein